MRGKMRWNSCKVNTASNRDFTAVPPHSDYVPTFTTQKSIHRFPPWEGSKTRRSISTQVVLVLSQVHHRPETLYMPTQVNTLQVDVLARISRLTQALYKSHPQPPNSVPTSPISDPPKH